jgi:hypothetical protein
MVVFHPYLVETQAFQQPDYKEALIQDLVGYFLSGLDRPDLDEIVGTQEQRYS